MACRGRHTGHRHRWGAGPRRAPPLAQGFPDDPLPHLQWVPVAPPGRENAAAWGCACRRASPAEEGPGRRGPRGTPSLAGTGNTGTSALLYMANHLADVGEEGGGGGGTERRRERTGQRGSGGIQHVCVCALRWTQFYPWGGAIKD
jgi:hypothetical protein